MVEMNSDVTNMSQIGFGDLLDLWLNCLEVTECSDSLTKKIHT